MNLSFVSNFVLAHQSWFVVGAVVAMGWLVCYSFLLDGTGKENLRDAFAELKRRDAK